MSGIRSSVKLKTNASPFKGRGTRLDPANRFAPTRHEAFDDGWTHEEAPQKPQTTLIRDATRSIISRNDSPDIGFQSSLNPYRGCEHGCIYCLARPSHAYLGFSPGLEFETQIVFKPEAPRLLEKELSRASYKPSVIVLGSNTDPYQPVERTLGLTRALLEVLERFQHPVGIITKSATILRDQDILTRMAARNLVRVHISLTTLDAALARAMEPRAATPKRRLQTITALSQAGIEVCVMASPMIPGLNDAELEHILSEAQNAGATSAAMSLVRLPHELDVLMTDWLHTHLPERATHVLSLLRQSRGGNLNDSEFHRRFSGTGAYAKLLSQRFENALRRLGLNTAESPLDCTRFRVPGSTPLNLQMNLF